jgi:hypothetical protein
VQFCELVGIVSQNAGLILAAISVFNSDRQWVAVLASIPVYAFVLGVLVYVDRKVDRSEVGKALPVSKRLSEKADAEENVLVCSLPAFLR